MIVAKGLTKQFKGQTVLNGIDLTVQPGEVVAIIGPSGSGKTTFLRCLNLLETPDAGQIQIGDISIDANRPLGGQQSAIRRLRQQAGFVFQNFNLFPHRTALENVIEGPVIVKKTPREQAIELGGGCWPRSAWRARKTPTHGAFPAASSSAWQLPARWPWNLK
jgi:L-cystine ABC transporter ATP-binding protein/Diaminopimelate ABC transporter ATP-binding protein